MSDNKKYYYLKLKADFYEQDHIAYIETLTHGYKYTNILMKLYLRSLKFNGCLKITENIPYDPHNLEPLAKVLRHDPSHVSEAINLAISFGIIKIIDSREMWMTDLQNYIGQSSTEGDRKRLYRKQLEDLGTNVRHSSTRDRDRDRDRDIEKDNEVNKKYLPLAKLIYELHKDHDNNYLARYSDKQIQEKISIWSNDIRLLVEKDKRIPCEVEAVIRWVKTPGNFWFANIQSGKTLRKQYDRLIIEYRRKVKPEEPKNEKDHFCDNCGKKIKASGWCPDCELYS